jgi:hypothetical protein
MILSTKELMAIAASDVFATNTASCRGAVGRQARMRCLPQLTCVAIQRQCFISQAKTFPHGNQSQSPVGNTAYQTPSVLPAAGSTSGRLITMPIEGLHLYPAVENVCRMAMDEMGGTASSEVIQEPILISPCGTILSGLGIGGSLHAVVIGQFLVLNIR